MIFVTVGAQMPFTRLVKAVDEWAAVNGSTDIFAQIGPTDWRPLHLSWKRFLNPQEYRRLFREASAVVAHAGMGSILTAMELGKPLIVMPRRGDLEETRNDHQVATARRLSASGQVVAVFNELELKTRLDQMMSLPCVLSPAETAMVARCRTCTWGACCSATTRIKAHASEELLLAIHRFLLDTPMKRPRLFARLKDMLKRVLELY